MVPHEHVVDGLIPDTINESHDLLITVGAFKRGAAHRLDARLAVAALELGTSNIQRITFRAANFRGTRLNELYDATDLQFANLVL